MRHAGGKTLRVLIALCVAVAVLLLACDAGTGHGHAALFLPVLAILLIALAPTGWRRTAFDAPLGLAPARVPSLPRSPPV